MATVFSEIEQNPGTSTDDNALVKYTRTFRGINQDYGVGLVTVRDDFSNSTGIRRFSPYVGPDLVGDPTCLASAIDVHQTDKMIEWIVTVHYSTMRFTARPNLSPRQQRERAAMAREHQSSGQQPPADPTERPPVLRIGSQEYEEALLFDAIETTLGQPKPITNAAGDRFVPPPTVTRSFRTVTLEKNERLFASDFTHGFENTVNEFTWYGYAPKTVLCKVITADADFEGRWDFWRVTYLFWIRKDTWILKLLNEGPNYYTAPVPDGGKLTRFKDETTSGGLGSVRPLAADGTALAQGAAPVWLEFNRYALRNFALLGLGT